eukprot:GEMP01083949.1.p2 GENE.GEMP01083949.1~~GEMP01083949.1.p2  ORF type:complete len:107 (+),score=25.70 GEMP01083949.1:62-382(+)
MASSAEKKATGKPKERFVVVDMPFLSKSQFLPTVKQYQVKDLDGDQPKIIADGFSMNGKRVDTFGTNLILEIPRGGTATPIGMSTETIQCTLAKTAKCADQKYDMI